MRNEECLQNTAIDYQQLWQETEPDLPWEQIGIPPWSYSTLEVE